LKSKGVLGSNEDGKEKGLALKNSLSIGQSPAKSDINITHNLAQSTPVVNNTKMDQRSSSIKRGSGQSLQIQNIPSGRSSEREKLKMELSNGYSLTPSAKDLQESTKNKSPVFGKAPISANNNLSKKNLNNKNGIPFSEKKEKTWSFIEEFVDTELEKDILSKGSKTTKNSMKSTNHIEMFSKSHLGWTSKNSGPSEKRASSALDMNGKNSRDNKNYTPNSLQNREEELSRKNSVPDSPITPLTEEFQTRKRNFLTPTQDFKGLPPKDVKNKDSALNVIVNGRSPRQMSSPKRITEESEKGLKDEVEKWRIFGKMMAESYDDLNKKYTEFMKEKEKDKKIVNALKDQVNTLKALLKASKDENLKIQESAFRVSKESLPEKNEAKEQKEIANLIDELEIIKNQNLEAMKIMDFLKNENEALKKTIEDGEKYKQVVEHYQKLADIRFKECSALAEEIICLRTDLDRSHSNYLRIQREQSSGKKINGENYLSGKKIRAGSDSEVLNTNSNITSAYKKLANVQVSNWNEETDDEPPLPADLKTIPSKEENTSI